MIEVKQTMNYRVKSIHEIKQLFYLYLIALYFKAKQNQCDSEEISVKGAQRPNQCYGEQLKKLGEGEAKYTYGGKELDDSTNLYYFNARYYDATIGRFINVDPIQDGTNWYVYCNNNPLSMVDPTGLEDIFMNSKQFDKMLNMYTYKSQERVSPGVNDAVGILGLVSKFSSFISSLFTPVNMANNRGVAENIGQIRLLSKLQGQYQDVLDNGGQFVLSHTQKKEMSKTDFGTMITKNYLTLDIIDADGNSVLDKKYDLSFQQKLVDSAKESKIDWDSLIKKAEDFEKKFNSRDVNDDVTIPNRSDRLKEQKSKADKETNFSY